MIQEAALRIQETEVMIQEMELAGKNLRVRPQEPEIRHLFQDKRSPAHAEQM